MTEKEFQILIKIIDPYLHYGSDILFIRKKLEKKGILQASYHEKFLEKHNNLIDLAYNYTIVREIWVDRIKELKELHNKAMEEKDV